MKKYETLFEICKSIGIEQFGVTSARPFLEYAEALSLFNDFCGSSAVSRIDPLETMPLAKSIICALFPYKLEQNDTPQIGVSGKIVSGDIGFGCDYHIYVKNKLKIVADELNNRYDLNSLCFCDTGPLADKAVAVRSGLCAFGRNSLAINEQYGSKFFIGYIITEVDFDNKRHDTARLYKGCERCEACVKACPSSALFFNYDKCGIEHKLCLSYVSQKKGALAEREARLLKDTLYGCHICQNVCPANDSVKFERYVSLENINKLSNRQFKRQFGNTAAVWIGKKTFLRNAEAVRKNL